MENLSMNRLLYHILIYFDSYKVFAFTLTMMKYLHLLLLLQAEEEVEEEDDTIYTYMPPVAKDWIPLGSEKEIEEEAWKPTRTKVGNQITFEILYNMLIFTKMHRKDTS